MSISIMHGVISDLTSITHRGTCTCLSQTDMQGYGCHRARIELKGIRSEKKKENKHTQRSFLPGLLITEPAGTADPTCVHGPSNEDDRAYLILSPDENKK